MRHFVEFISRSDRQRHSAFQNNKRLVYVLLIFIYVVVSGLLYFNRSATDVGGWDDYVTDLIFSGEVPYKDFFYYVPPLYIFRDAFLIHLTDHSVILYRIFGLSERALLFICIFLVMEKWCKPAVACICSMIAYPFYNSLAFNSYGDYTQLSQVFMALTALAAINAYQIISHVEDGFRPRRAYKWAFLAGSLAMQSAMTKQSIGAAAMLAVAVAMILLILFEKEKAVWAKALLGYILGVFIGAIPWLIYFFSTGSFSQFIEQVLIGAANSKGVVSESTSGNDASNLSKVIKTLVDVKSFALTAAVVAGSIFVHLPVNGIRPKRKRITQIVFAATAVLAFFWYADIPGVLLAWLHTISLLTITGLIGYIVLPILVISIAQVFIVRRSSEYPDHGFDFAVCITLIYLLTGMIIYGCSNEVDKSISAAFRLSALAPKVYGAMFYIDNAYFITDFVIRKGIKRQKEPYYPIFFLAAGDANALISLLGGGTASFSANGTLLIIPMFCYLLYLPGREDNERVPAPIRQQSHLRTYAVRSYRIMTAAAAAVCVMLLGFGSNAVRFSTPYSFWGWTSGPISSSSVYTIDLEEYRGMRVNKRDKVVLEEVTKLIALNSDEDDFVLTFPECKIYNVLAKRLKHPTFTLVYFFDVCPDDYAVKDAEILKNNLPKVIVWKDLGDSCWTFYEKNYRTGSELGQRAIQRWFDSVKDSMYTCVGTVYNDSVYVLNDGRPIKYTFTATEKSLVNNPEEVETDRLDSMLKDKIVAHFGANIILLLGLSAGFALFFMIKLKYRMWKLFCVAVLFGGCCFHVTLNYWFLLCIPLIWYMMDSNRGKNPLETAEAVLCGAALLQLCTQWQDGWPEMSNWFYGTVIAALSILLIELIYRAVFCRTERRKKVVQ